MEYYFCGYDQRPNGISHVYESATSGMGLVLPASMGNKFIANKTILNTPKKSLRKDKNPYSKSRIYFERGYEAQLNKFSEIPYDLTKDLFSKMGISYVDGAPYVLVRIFELCRLVNQYSQFFPAVHIKDENAKVPCYSEIRSLIDKYRLISMQLHLNECLLEDTPVSLSNFRLYHQLEQDLKTKMSKELIRQYIFHIKLLKPKLDLHQRLLNQSFYEGVIQVPLFPIKGEDPLLLSYFGNDPLVALGVDQINLSNHVCTYQFDSLESILCMIHMDEKKLFSYLEYLRNFGYLIEPFQPKGKTYVLTNDTSCAFGRI